MNQEFTPFSLGFARINNGQTLDDFIRTSPSVNCLFSVYLFCFVNSLLLENGSEVQQEIGLRVYNRPVLGSTVPWPQCKPRARSSIISRHDSCPLSNQGIRTPV
jgi:hypothetical protein